MAKSGNVGGKGTMEEMKARMKVRLSQHHAARLAPPSCNGWKQLLMCVCACACAGKAREREREGGKARVSE